MPYHTHSVAICRIPPSSLVDCVSKHDGKGTIEYDKAREQHQAYVEVLKRHFKRVVVLDPLVGFPDSVFVEDNAIIFGGRVLITQSGHPTRRGEAEFMGRALHHHLPDHQIFRMTDEEYCDGGDILNTGKHLLVGQSHRTNRKGYEKIRQVFGDLIPVIAYPTPLGTLHLKCIISALDDETLLTTDMDQLEELRAMVRDFGYKLIHIGDPMAANVVSLGYHRGPGEVLCTTEYPESLETMKAAMAEREGWRVTALNMSELAKADGSTTCLSLLV